MDSSPLFVINFYDPEMPLTLQGRCFLSYEMKGWDSIYVLRGQRATHMRITCKVLQMQIPPMPTLTDRINISESETQDSTFLACLTEQTSQVI